MTDDEKQAREKAFGNQFSAELFELVAMQGEKAQASGVSAMKAVQRMTVECLYMAAKMVTQCSGMSLTEFLQGCQLAYELAKRHAAMTPRPDAKPN